MPDPQDRRWTKGEWIVRTRYGYATEISSDGGVIAGFGRAEQSDSEIDANARLIAAAPELYNAAKTAFDFLDNWEPGAPGWTDTTEELRAALSKALGGRIS